MHTLALHPATSTAHSVDVVAIPGRPTRFGIGTAVAVVHASVIAALLTATPTPQAYDTTAPILVSFITPSAAHTRTAPTIRQTTAVSPASLKKPTVESVLTSMPAQVTSTPVTPVQPPGATETDSRNSATPPPSATTSASSTTSASQPAHASTSASASARDVPVSPPDFTAAYLANPAPAYPALARRQGQEGRVVLRVLVDTRGQPARIELRSTSGHERLDEAALAAVRTWKFAPARRGDAAVEAWVLVPLSFSLRS